ncbi:MAG TPA: helix-turn-helix transcriptional regulator [Vicinamibacterales bacterium]|nr:helix-turn-helix transcriptional regulator [Vicinamibacterales bacterium]
MPDAHDYLPLSAQQFHILLALADADRHGYGILLEIARRTDGATRLGTGTLYTAIAGLEDDELVVEAPQRRSERDDRRRFYRLTPLGRRVLRAETARLESLVRHAKQKGIQPAW